MNSIMPVRFCVAFILALNCFSFAAQADTITETGTFGDINHTKAFELPNERIPFLFTSPITGINQFDPELGTLNSISLTAELRLDLETEVRAFSGNGNDWTLGLTLSPIVVEVGHAPTGSGSFVATDTESAAATTSSSGPSVPETVSSESTQNIEMILTGPVSIHPDFVGTGTVDTLEAQLSYALGALEADFTLDQLAGVSAEVTMALSNVSLTVEYDFTAIPEPSALLYLGLATSMFGLIRRR